MDKRQYLERRGTVHSAKTIVTIVSSKEQCTIPIPMSVCIRYLDFLVLCTSCYTTLF